MENRILQRLQTYFRKITDFLLNKPNVTVLIPVCDDRSLETTIQSVLLQQFGKVEILILRNGCNEINDGKNVTINSDQDFSVMKIFIQEKGKGNALNVGIRNANYDYICVLDADCKLLPNSFTYALRHFIDDHVVAVGGRLLTITEEENAIFKLQDLEYKKTFHLMRPAFNKINANCIISGAFGMFRKEALQFIGGYDIDTVGEDMELVLRLQEYAREKGWKVVYEKKSECATFVPKSLYRLCRQRERWQRGLLDCLKKHRKMIVNPKYGLLGMLALPYQVISELFGPVFLMFHLVNIICAIAGFTVYFEITYHLGLPDIYQSWTIYGIYVAAECGITIWADFIDQEKNIALVKRIPMLVVVTLESILLQVILAFAKIFGMVTFRWRRLVW